jgi:hypothetical protein
MISVVHVQRDVSVTTQPILFAPETLATPISIRIDIAVGEDDHWEWTFPTGLNHDARDGEPTRFIRNSMFCELRNRAKDLTDLKVTTGIFAL